jgi:hypothetical protein
MHKRVAAMAIGLAITGAVVTSGCGSDSKDGSATTTASASKLSTESVCGLLTAADIKDALGVEPGYSVFQSNTCDWKANESDNQSILSLSVQPNGNDFFNELKPRLADATAPAPGVGTDSFISKGERWLYFVVGQDVYTVVVSAQIDPAKLDQANIALGKAAAQRVH